jgi:hypothetical protein
MMLSDDHGAPDNPFNPTANSAAFEQRSLLSFGLPLSSGGGLIRALRRRRALFRTRDESCQI